MSHTPGPWVVKDDYVVGERYICQLSDWAIVAGSQYQEENKALQQERDANANLIAAAPDLLKALEACTNKLAMWPEGANPEFLPCMKAARAIIKKVRGN